jgi:DnaJ-class molecular chaperone
MSDAMAVLRGLKPCKGCQSKRLLFVARQIAGKMYHLKVLCKTCNGKGWYNPEMAQLYDMGWSHEYIDPDIE